MTFHVGDRVMCTAKKIIRLGKNIYYGDTGVICCEKREEGSGLIRVRWDKLFDGHSCGGNCEKGHGWNVNDYQIVILSSEDDTDEANAACSGEELVALLF